MHRNGHGQKNSAQWRGELGGLTRSRLGDQRGQASPEWVALILLLAALLALLLVIAPLRQQAFLLAESIAGKLLCAVKLGGGCGSAVEQAYAAEIAALVRQHTPSIEYERGMVALPVDFRACFADVPCSYGARSGAVGETRDGKPATAFVRVVDCREGARSDGVNCTGAAAGNLYLQYWLYYPESATLAEVPVARERGYHLHDWESYQVRVGADGAVSARASSHKSYNNGNGLRDQPANWISNSGVRDRAAWGPVSGWTFVSGGSHAGHVPRGDRAPERMTPAAALELIPLETLTDDDRDRPWTEALPPWLKRVYYFPESTSTG